MKKIASGFWRAIPRTMRRAIIRLTQTSFTVSASAVVFDSAGRVLLLEHVLRPAEASWDIVGGYLSADEQPAESLRREVREEAGITIKNLRLLDFYTRGQPRDCRSQMVCARRETADRNRRVAAPPHCSRARNERITAFFDNGLKLLLTYDYEKNGNHRIDQRNFYAR